MKLTDKNGKEIKTGRATTAFVVDYDGDGDLDILSGDIDGSVHLLRNESGGKALTFGEKEKIQAGGAPIKTPGGNSGPTVVDWDGDGKLDLLVGCGDGSVRFYRNTAARGEPTFGAHETLLTASSTYPSTTGERSSPCGSRVKLAVHDWNGDGKPDLLLGDFSSKSPPPMKLTDEQTKHKAELEAKQQELQPKMQEHYQRFQAEALKRMGIEPGAGFPEMDDEQRRKYGEVFRQLMESDEAFMALQKEMQGIWQELSKYRGQATLAGNVWLMLRR